MKWYFVNELVIRFVEATKEDIFQLLWPYTHINSTTTNHLATRGYLDNAFIVSALMADVKEIPGGCRISLR